MRTNSIFETSTVQKKSVNSLCRNILRVTSLDARFCGSRSEATSITTHQINILPETSEKNIDSDPTQDPRLSNSGPTPLGIDIDAFAWTYSQKSGELEQDGKPVATGYSGAGAGKNNPALQNVPNVGPIPQGDWTIVGPPTDTSDHGPYVLKLNPVAGTETFGRSGFLMHGDSKEHPGYASHGCIILPRSVREQVWNSGDSELEVLADISPAEAGKNRGD